MGRSQGLLCGPRTFALLIPVYLPGKARNAHWGIPVWTQGAAGISGAGDATAVMVTSTT